MTRPHIQARRPLAALLAVVLAFAGLVALDRGTAPSAGAATTGAGYRGITPYGGYLGNYIAPDGTRVYCIDSGLDWPSGATGGAQAVSGVQASWGGWLSGEQIKKLNFALSTWGQTADPTVAAAVSAFVYAYASNFAGNNGQGYGAGAHYINGNAAVLREYNEIWRRVETEYSRGVQPAASLDLELANGWDGTVTIGMNTSALSGILSLEGATVAGSARRWVHVANGTVVPIRVDADAAATSQTVRASVEFIVQDRPQQSLTLYSTPGQQRTIRGGSFDRVAVRAADEAVADLRFSPIVETTVASRFVNSGSAFVDGLTASVAPGSPEWRVDSSGEVPVTAVGTLYGPFAEQPAVSDTVPAGAPVVGSESVTLTGPGDYRSPGTLIAPSAGFYTWVWTIDAAQQPEPVRALLPDGYAFADQFGLVAESHVVPTALRAASQVSTPEAGFGAAIGDSLSVSIDHGLWLAESGEPIAAEFEGTAYFVPGGDAPAVSDTVPADAVVLGTARVTAPGPGVYEASTTVTAPQTAGFVSWVWRLDPASSTAPYFEPWSDKFGLPTETARILPPTVSTLAVPAVAIGDEVHDTALVGGYLPAQPSSLVFEAYLQPSGATQPLCDESNRVFDSSDEPVEVSAIGTYSSPSTRFEEYGTYYWVESLYAHDGTLLHRGECGLAEETTLVAPGEVVTEAVQIVEPGAEAHDVARVSGLVPDGATLVFEAFAQHGIEDGPLCDASTRVFRSEPIAVVEAGTYRSDAVVLDRPGTYHWVETLYDRHGDPLHIGECGLAAETTRVGTPRLPNTGLELAPAIAIAVALLGVGLGILRRRSRWVEGE
ncbi:hypothetical protein [Antiquaquibacter soli]|uniref:LPXTG cell wall anchor domain-containing protein n=1 Tax=Antiquaquibacter soli TaxID=3064523 RepID=A0ABT9BMD6_9MICO|nr:hypothetical protein [Protaetiibacter sp. WY-16]MDO7882165.1 hypothetical protein [Protaetiibacter sp. WY-16]